MEAVKKRLTEFSLEAHGERSTASTHTSATTSNSTTTDSTVYCCTQVLPILL